MLKLKKFGLSLFFISSLQLVNAPSAVAQIPFLPDGIGFSIDLPAPIADIFSDFSQIVGALDTFLSELGIDVPLGELGIPALESAETILAENNQIDIVGDVFGSQTGSTFDLRDKLFQEYLNDLGGEFAQNSALSLEGQETIQAQIEAAQEIVETSQEISSNSSTAGLFSENILLSNISTQLSLQTQLDNLLFFETEEDKIARALDLSMNGQSLIELSKQTTRAQREATSIYKTALYNQALLSIPGQYLLNE